MARAPRPKSSGRTKGGRTVPSARVRAPRQSSPGLAFTRLVSIMAHLRGPDGCPWDREQTLTTLKPFVLEEAYEVVEAIDRHDIDELRGELGDLVFEAVFLAQLCAEAGHFTIGDAVQHVVDKLIRRHPHVFGTKRAQAAHVDTAAKVVTQWDAIKAQERQTAGKPNVGPLGDIPLAMPALSRALHISKRAAKVGFEWATARDVLLKVKEELAEVEEAMASGALPAIEEELGDLLFSITNLARKSNIDPEAALRAANKKFARRFAAMALHLESRGLALDGTSLAEMEASWTHVKEQERATPVAPRRSSRGAR